jgi:hypothetical protein
VFLAQRLRVEPALLQGSQRRLIADENIRRCDQFPQCFPTLGMIVIQCNRSLVPVRCKKIGRLAPHERRSPAARLVTHARPLDFNDVCAKVSEEHRAIRTGKRLAQFDNAHVIQNVFRAHGA